MRWARSAAGPRPVRAPGHEFLDPVLDVQGRSYGRDGGFTIEAVELGQIHDPFSNIL